MNTLHVNVHYLPLLVYYQPREQRREGSPMLSVGGAATSVEQGPPSDNLHGH